MAAFQRGAHDFSVAGGIEAVVGPAIRDLNDLRHGFVARQTPAVDEMSHAELAAPFLTVSVDFDADDLARAHHLGALDHIEADAAKAEDDDILARLHLCGVDDRANPGGDAAADIAARLERRVLPDFRHRDFRQNGEVGESGATHIVKDRLPLVGKAGRAVGHQPLALGSPDRGAKVGLAR